MVMEEKVVIFILQLRRLFEKRISNFYLLIGIFLFSTVGLAQDPIQKKSQQKTVFSRLGITPLDDTLATEHNGFIFMPVVYFSPDTRLGLGAAGAYIFHLTDQSSILHQATRTSFIRFSGAYTINKQTDFLSEWGVFTPSERFFLKGDLRFRIFPDRFYGIGNNSASSNLEIYEYKLFNLRSSNLKKIRNNLFLGISIHLNKQFDFQNQPNGLLSSGSVLGANGGFNSGLGGVLIYDTRDNVLNSSKGMFLEFSSLFYHRAYGSSFNFQVAQFEYCKYWKIKPKHILAWQTRSRFTFGSVPFLEMSMVGNDDILRGYPRNRFRDNHNMLTQVEYRFPLFWRFGMTAFAGLGDVFSRPQDLSWRNTKYTVGAGLRFLVNTAERINIRLDYGYGSEGGFIYINVAEAF
jgi:hypothetical protein